MDKFNLEDHKGDDIKLIREEMLKILNDSVATDSAKEKAGRLLARMHKTLDPERVGSKKDVKKEEQLPQKVQDEIQAQVKKILSDV